MIYMLKPPTAINLMRINRRTVFLAGSIEMGKAVDWQTVVTRALLDSGIDEDVLVLNPRRDDWDSTWTQAESNPQFNEQVTWELNGLDASQAVFFYFQPGTVSPISLLELGLMLNSEHDPAMFIVCPEGYARKGNVDITAHRTGHAVYGSLEGGIAALVSWLKD
jgi:hypothetical protein